MILLDRWALGGLRFILERIADAVDAEADDATALREDLLAAQMRLELGEIDEEEFARRENEIIARLREFRGDQGGAMTLSAKEELSVDVLFDSDDEEA